MPDLGTQLRDYFTATTEQVGMGDLDTEIKAQPLRIAPTVPSKRSRSGWVYGLAAAVGLVVLVGGAAALTGWLGGPSAESEPVTVASEPGVLRLAERYYEAYNARDGAALTELFADDVVLSFLPGSFGPFVGKDEVLAEQLQEISRPDEFELTLSDAVVEGNTVRGSHSMEIPGHLLTGTVEIVIEDGKISRIAIILDEESARQLERG